MRAFIVAALLVIALLGPRLAHAETAAVLTPSTEEPVTDETADRCLKLVAEWLGERGIEVVLPTDAALHLPAGLKECNQEQCALEYLRYIEKADYAVLTAIWGQARGSGATGVNLTFLTRAGQRYDERWAVTESLALSVDAALTHAYTSFLRGPSSMETATSATAPAATPATNPTPPAEPRPSDAYTPAEADGSTVIDPLDEENRDDPSPSAWNYLLGGTLIAASIPLIAFPLAMYALDGECYKQDKANRCRRYYFGPLSEVSLTAGVISLTSGTTLLIFAPISSSSELPDSAALTLVGTF